ncbi:MAG: Gfo/Idh/MocA family oxidoreductase [Saprospiraceae bacterium]|nr:Gfo/Idh/MocA family oxidoreductase [Saprospiraceae bacterium]
MLNLVKAGIIGLDEVGKSFATLINEHVKFLELMAASGRSQNELLFAKNDMSLPYVYSDTAQLIENHDVDALFVFCAPEQKVDLTTKAIEAGKHVFISQPIATNVEDAAYLIKIAERHPSQVSMAGYPHRLNASFIQLKQLLDKGVIGDVLSIDLDSNLTQNLSSQFITASGSPFIDYGLNEIDIVLWLLGKKPIQVDCHTSGDVIIASLKMENNIDCDFRLFQNSEPRHSILKITGTNGCLEYDNHTLVIKKTNYHGDMISSVYAKDQLNCYHLDYLHAKHFVDVIFGYKKSSLKLSHNLHALKVAIAMEKSKTLKDRVQIEWS